MTLRLRVTNFATLALWLIRLSAWLTIITLGKPFWPFRLRAGPGHEGRGPASKAPPRRSLPRALAASTISFAWRRTPIRAYQEV